MNELAGLETISPEPPITKYHVWLYDWSARTEGVADFPLRMKAKTDDFAIDLVLTSRKSYVLQGDRGLEPEKPGTG